MSPEFLPQIDKNKCIVCELCIKVCPNHVLAMVNHIPAIAQPDACDYTGACQEICPTGAISLPFEIG